MDKKKIHEFVNESNIRKGEKEKYERQLIKENAAKEEEIRELDN